nr:hypothetical protein AKG93_25155 [Vibrio harveyi]
MTTLIGLGGAESVTSLNKLIAWPLDIFLVLYSLIDFTDKYRMIVSPESSSWNKSDLTEGIELYKDWLTHLNYMRDANKPKITSQSNLIKHLKVIFKKNNFNTCVYELCSDPVFLKSVFKVLISIDELLSEQENLKNEKSSLKFFLDTKKIISINESNLSNNNPKTGTVIYKYLVPQSGLTINNLTHNLTFLKPSVKPHLTLNKVERQRFDKTSYNILFLPWPMEIESSSFTVSKHKSNIETDKYFDFFDYCPTKEISESHFLCTVISSLERSGYIDMIVLPECSVSPQVLEKLKGLLFDCFGNKAPALLAGVFGEDEENPIYSKNCASLSFIGTSNKYDTIEQNKHHRWFLDGSQLTNYNLANALDPGKKWWENIRASRRKLVSLQTGENIRVCPLICEDLARQDPVAQAVRAVGPNLVVSLLLDGPQIEQRWPGKYASVLSEDPGSSVLSVTALGMTLRSTGSGFDPSRQVALWSESGKKPETLELKKDGSGIVIELKMKTENMWTMDGRLKEKQILRKVKDSTVFSNSELSELSTESLKNILVGMVSKDEH